MTQKRLSCQPCREIRIKDVSDLIHEDLTNIKDHVGIPRNQLLNPLIVEWLEMFPEHMKNGTRTPTDFKKEVRLSGYGKRTKALLKNISSYTGVAEKNILRIALVLCMGKFPDEMRQKMIK